VKFLNIEWCGGGKKMNRIDEIVASRNKRIKEIREEDGTLVLTDNEVPAGMGNICFDDEVEE